MIQTRTKISGESRVSTAIGFEEYELGFMRPPYRLGRAIHIVDTECDLTSEDGCGCGGAG